MGLRKHIKCIVHGKETMAYKLLLDTPALVYNLVLCLWNRYLTKVSSFRTLVALAVTGITEDENWIKNWINV